MKMDSYGRHQAEEEWKLFTVTITHTYQVEVWAEDEDVAENHVIDNETPDDLQKESWHYMASEYPFKPWQRSMKIERLYWN
jgi:hypothetical protein